MADTPKDAARPMTAAETLTLHEIATLIHEVRGWVETPAGERRGTEVPISRLNAALMGLAALRGPGHPEPPAERRTAMSSNPPPPCSHFRPGAVPVTCATCGQEQRFHNPLPPAGLSRDDLVVALERLAAAGCIMGRAVGCDLRTESACIYCVAKESLAALRALPAAPRPDAGEAPDYKTALKTALAAALTPSAPDAPGTPPDGDTR